VKYYNTMVCQVGCLDLLLVAHPFHTTLFVASHLNHISFPSSKSGEGFVKSDDARLEYPCTHGGCQHGGRITS
jgi:hypothetical protein